MTHEFPFATPAITTALNIAGIFASVYLWVFLRAGARVRVAWLVPIFIACTGLEAGFATHWVWLGQDNRVMLGDVVRRSGLDLLVWPAIGLTCYHARRWLPQRAPSPPRSSPSSSSAHEPASATIPSLESAIGRFIAAADVGDVAVIAATYAPGFTCVRVADDGGFARLSGEQMLAFWGKPATAARKHALPARTTTIHHLEIMGDTGIALLTRVKDFGHGWEPVFYTLLWRLENARWRLLRELVHQRNVPARL